MSNCNPVSTPMQAIDFSKADAPAPGTDEFYRVSKFDYRSVIGSLQQICRFTRPDISFAVGCVSRFSHNYGQKHISAVKRILKYLQGTKHLQLKIEPLVDNTIVFNSQLVGFADADWGNDKDAARSTSGYGIYVGSALISWGSRLQPKVSTSTTEAEYVACYYAETELIWMRSWLSSMGLLNLDESTVLYTDNQAAIKLAQFHMVTARSKHIDTKYNFLRHQVQHKKLNLKFIPGLDNTADIFTKPLPGPRFRTLRNLLKLTDAPNESE